MKNNFQSIYDKTIKLFSENASWKAISIISFFESIIFPVPTDLFLIPAIIANKNKVIFLIFVTVFFSVVGGIVGYMIGFFFWDIVSEYFYIFYPNFEARFNTFKSTFNSYGWLFVLAGGFTPFPFKIAAVSSGILDERGDQSKINMVLIQDENNDTTNNLSILCPTPGFSKNQFRRRHRCVIIYHKNEYYEPLFDVELGAKQRVKTETPFFMLNKGNTLYDILERVRINVFEKCTTQIDDSYKFKESIDIHRLYDKHDKWMKKVHAAYNVKQILNFDNKVIGIHLTHVKRDMSFFIPLKPSSLYADMEFDYIDDNVWTDFTTTQQKLTWFHESTKKDVACQPKRFVVENHVVVGILTESNQFVKIKEPLPVNELPDEGKSMEKKIFYNITDLEQDLLSDNSAEDEGRKQFIRNLRLEKQFYAAYVNTIQYHIHDEMNYEVKKRIQTVVESENSFQSKHEELYEILSESESESESES